LTIEQADPVSDNGDVATPNTESEVVNSADVPKPQDDIAVTEDAGTDGTDQTTPDAGEVEVENPSDDIVAADTETPVDSDNTDTVTPVETDTSDAGTPPGNFCPAGKICDDGDQCTTDVCQEGFGCVYVPIGNWTTSPCKKSGVCSQGGGVAACADNTWDCDYSGIAGYEAVEVSCDGLDNNCNGVVDDGLQAPVDLVCPKKGVCETISMQAKCLGGKWQCDYSVIDKYEPVELSCDGHDNDCDGETDEQLIKFTTPGDGICALPEGVCANAPATCENAKWKCRLDMVDGYSFPETKEKGLCADNLDNDCDGFTDDADPGC